MRAWLLAVGACGLAIGCGFHGDSTFGEENRSTWRIDDGLCPGTEGGCGMETPVAAGVELSVDADVPCAVPRRDSSGELVSDCSLIALDAVAAGAAEMRRVEYDEADGRIDLRVYAVEGGVGELELIEADGARFDRVTFDVRDAVDLECGRVGDRGARWDMPGLDQAGTYTVASSGADRETNVELGCRVVDADGEPLFSAAAILWQLVEGPDGTSIDDGGLFGDDASTGARIYARFTQRGTIRLVARFGELSRELTVVVE